MARCGRSPYPFGKFGESSTPDLTKSDNWLMEVVLKDGGIVAWTVSDSIGGDCGYARTCTSIPTTFPDFPRAQAPLGHGFSRSSASSPRRGICRQRETEFRASAFPNRSLGTRGTRSPSLSPFHPFTHSPSHSLPGRFLGRDDTAAGSISQELCGGGGSRRHLCHRAPRTCKLRPRLCLLTRQKRYGRRSMVRRAVPGHLRSALPDLRLSTTTSLRGWW